MRQTNSIDSAQLRSASQGAASGMPALIAKARHLAATLALGVHGRKRAGMGEEFWQYRRADAGDTVRDIDWRRSAQSDQYFVRQTEWQTAQAVHFWIDQSASMEFRAGNPDQSKSERANVLALALAILLSKGGERFAHLDDPSLPKTGESQVERFATHLVQLSERGDYGIPAVKTINKGARAVLISDFLGDWGALVQSISQIAEQDVQGVLLQVLDPQELSFPFTGRTIFESMKGTLSFEARRASGLRDAYLDRLNERQSALSELARNTGWRFDTHQTDVSAQTGVLWLYHALETDA